MGVLVGKPAPTFIAKAVAQGHIIDNFTLEQFRGKNVVFFFYPLNFTFVCPTELHAFQERLTEFEQRNTQVVACSVDSPYCHYAWLHTPKNSGGIQGITYPIVSDISKKIAKDYDVLLEKEGIAFRGLFLIDKNGVVRHQIVNDLPLGRSVDEVLRMIDALNYFEAHGEVCPANWQEGRKSMQASFEGVKNYFAQA